MYNFIRVTKSNNLVVNHLYHFTRVTTKIRNNFDRILYMLFKSVYRSYIPTWYYLIFFTPQCLVFLSCVIIGSMPMPQWPNGGGGLEWVVESTTVPHSSADWWDILLPLA